MISDGHSDDLVELVPVSYQFETLPDDNWDANWLMIQGSVRLHGERWNFVDPALLVWEALELGEWLRQVSDDEVEVAVPDDDGELYPQVSFLEPNLGVAVVARTPAAVTMRFFFSHESVRPDLIPAVVKSRTDTSVDLTVGRSSIANAATDWLAELQQFPERTGRRR